MLVNMKEEKKLIYNKNFFHACKNAFSGIKYTIKTQINIKIQLIIAIIMVILGIIFKLNNIEWISLFFAIFLVVITEMINTGIETVVDLYTTEFHPKAKIAKDVGAGAVVLAAINAIIIGYLLFFHRLVETIFNKG